MSLNFTNPDVYHVATTVNIAHSYHFVNNLFESKDSTLAELYKPWKRCLAIVDSSVYDLYGPQIKAYFEAHGITATVQPAHITEEKKSVETLLEICAYMTNFDIIRREPVLAIGGGLVTDVVGFACAIYRRSTPWIRIPTTVIGLIDASVSNRVAVNWNGLKNRIGSYHEPLNTLVDPTFLKSLPVAEVRNGVAEILKITSCTDLATFEALEQYGESFIQKRFGHLPGDNGKLASIGEVVLRKAIQLILEVEVPNSREQSLDRVMYFGHTWSPNLELAVHPPLLHGHAISVDMCFSAAIARHLGLLSSDQYHRFINVFSTLGLAVDHPAFTMEIMKEGTLATIATRDGKLRAPVPTGGLGTHEILPMVDDGVLELAWKEHKNAVQGLPRKGLGLDVNTEIRTAHLQNGH